ncbi:MAG: ankyrin repeat domain-containing protein [Sulfuritalea sp.]|nr:ankyrin repeat domain-containing protein [Sulfuritalea sp.]
MKILYFLLVFVMGTSSLHAATQPDAARFSIAIEGGDLASAREWLDGGLPPDFEGAMIGTGVMIGAWEGNLPMMELFVGRGANINRTNALGEQALQHAAWKGHLAAVRWLVERGAHLNRQGREWSALHYAVFGGHADVVRYLIERGADVNALSTNGSTPLMMAAREGREAIAKSLLGAGARRDIVNEHGEDALRWAMRHNHLSIARLVAGNEKFAVAAAKPATAWGPVVRSQAVPDRADGLMAQARRLEAEGRRDEALSLYRAALAAIRQADAARKILPAPARTAKGLVITARRGDPEAQTAALNYATPAGVGDVPQNSTGTGTAVGAGDTAQRTTADPADEWLRRARELEAAGRRKEALQAYREAAAIVRTGNALPGLVLSPTLQARPSRGLAPPP